jgi:hypothetical protein
MASQAVADAGAAGKNEFAVGGEFEEGAVWWIGSARCSAVLVNDIRGPVSARPAWGRTTRAAPLTNSWSGVRDGENRPPANVAGAHGWRFRWDSARNGETRKCRKGGQLRTCGRREALTGRPESLRGKGLAPRVKQRVFYAVETLAK